MSRPDALSQHYHEERNSNIGARYALAQSTIWLSKQIQVFDDDGSVNPAGADHWAVFLHEYLHYLHNYSTVVGIEQVVGSLALAGTYGNTILPPYSGESAGSTALDDAGIHFCKRLIFAQQHFAGRRVAFPFSPDRIQATGFRRESAGNGPLQRALVSAHLWQRGTSQSFEFELTAHHIEEGLAVIFEDMYLESVGAPSCPRPYDPYEVLRDVVKSYVADASQNLIFELGTISLNTTNPGVWLMSVLEHNKGASDAHMRSGVSKLDWKRAFASAKNLVLEKMDKVENTFRDRGILGVGVASILGVAKELLGRRDEAPIFELDLERRSTSDFHELVTTVLPCEVVLERDGRTDSTARDILLTFWPDDKLHEVEGRRAVQSAVHAMQRHLSSSKGFVSGPMESPCPHYTFCSSAARDADQACRIAPWQSLARTRSDHCWYANGMLGLIATVGRASPPASP